jgi:hypothetical protein
MHSRSPGFRLTAIIAVVALLLAQVMPGPALAQSTPPAPPLAGAQDQQTGDPPARVGRLAQVSGSVSFHAQDATQWSPAKLNYPVMQGSAFWTQPNALALIEISASRVAMAPGTELDVATLTDAAFQAALPQGELYLRVRAAPNETYAVQTPRGLVTLAGSGRYGIVAGDTQNATVVTVVEGSARVEGPGVSLEVGPGQAASITGTDTFQGAVAPAQHDAFLAAMLTSERPPQPQGVAPPATVAEMPGGEDLAQYGSWSDSSDYGEVWYPQVAPDWVPYRDGSWSNVGPWGWTWVDSEPWGFAPFHYGRWAEIGGRWGWIPGQPPASGYRPVYAPALVTFLGVGAAVGVGVGAALAAGRVGWLPLGPREPFHPWYHASDGYFRQINVPHVANVAAINREMPINSFVNRGAATVVPAGAMIGSRPVSGAFERVDPGQLAAARPVTGQPPLAPSPAMHAIAPGPAIHAMPAGIAAGAMLAHPAPPALTGAAHPFTATPALRTPSAPGQIAPPAMQHEPGLAGQGAILHQPPSVYPGNGGAMPQYHVAPGATFHQPTPPAQLSVVHPTPPVVVHPPQPAVVHGASPPPPVMHTAPAAVHVAPAPAPQVHAPPAPQAHAPPPQQNAQHKRPGEQ